MTRPAIPPPPRCYHFVVPKTKTGTRLPTLNSDLAGGYWVPVCVIHCCRLQISGGVEQTFSGGWWVGNFVVTTSWILNVNLSCWNVAWVPERCLGDLEEH